MYAVDLINETLDELENKANKCDSDIASVALGLGRLVEISFSSKEINEDEMTEIFDKADKITTRFRHNCFCHKK